MPAAEAALPLAAPFAGRTGLGVRIAVIDSGTHPGHPHIVAARLAGGVAVLRDGTLETGADATLDRLGHGTAVTAAIQEKAPDAEILTIRVFHDALKASARALVTAMDWAVEQGADIINLSLGSRNPAHRNAFSAAVDAARMAGCVTVAAHVADGEPCLPGALPDVWGVGLDWDCRRDGFRLHHQEDTRLLMACGYPRSIPGVPPRRNLYGISFAVAQISGFAALACEQARNEHGGDDWIARARAAMETAAG